MKKTPIFIIAVIAAIVVADFYFVFADGADQSISAYLIRWSKEFPSISFLMGFVMGHLFWRMPDKRVGEQ